MIVPLADAANHNFTTNADWTLVNKRLHIPAALGSENKVYVYEHDFDGDDEEKPLEIIKAGSDKLEKEVNSKWNLKVQRLYQEDIDNGNIEKNNLSKEDFMKIVSG